MGRSGRSYLRSAAQGNAFGDIVFLAKVNNNGRWEKADLAQKNLPTGLIFLFFFASIRLKEPAPKSALPRLCSCGGGEKRPVLARPQAHQLFKKSTMLINETMPVFSESKEWNNEAIDSIGNLI